MRVLVVTPWYPEGGDGAGSFVEDQVRSISGGHDVAVVHLRASRGVPGVVEAQGGAWPVLRVSSRLPAVPGGFVLRDLAGLLAATRRLHQGGFRPQILHAHVHNAGLAALPVARALGIPLVVSEHFSGVALGKVRGRARLAASVAYRRADLVCPASESLRAALERMAPGTRTRVVSNGVATDLFKPAEPGTAAHRVPRRILAVTSLVPVKGVDTLIEAMALLRPRREDVRLRVVGDGPRRAEYERLARARGVSERIELVGRLPREGVAAAMRDAELLVVPSRWETFSVATAEALCCGLPVLATRVGALPELVDGSSGRLVEPGEPGALAAGIESMLDSSGAFDRAAIARRAAERWSSEAVAAAWGRVYAELTAPSR